MEVAVASVIGKSILASALIDLYGFLKNSAHIMQLEQVLADLDITAELDVVSALLEDIDKYPKSTTVDLCTKQINQIIELIHKELTKVHEALEYHQTLYFKNWRSYGIDGNVRRLRKYKEQLKTRTDRLLQVLNVQKRTEPPKNRIQASLDKLIKVLD